VDYPCPRYRPSSPDRRARNIADPGGKRFEDRSHCWKASSDRDHHAVTALEAPDAAAGADVHIVKPFLLRTLERRTSSLKYEFPPSMRCPRALNAGERLTVSLGWTTRWTIDPDRAAAPEFADQIPSEAEATAPSPASPLTHRDSTDTTTWCPPRTDGAPSCSRPSGQPDHSHLHEFLSSRVRAPSHARPLAIAMRRPTSVCVPCGQLTNLVDGRQQRVSTQN